MSDFDKETEREKLREKYERDQEKRETAEKMSELLLQGATMTNAHCSDCGDPIFRYDGQEFCATCEKAVDRATDEDADAGDADAEDADAGDAVGDSETIEVTSPSDDERVQFGSGDGSGTGDQPETEADTARDAGGEASRRPADRTSPEPARTDSSRGEPADSRREARTGSRSGPPVDVSAARESLVRTLTRFSDHAEATDDPQQAREYLAAAREAAEVLAALRR